VELHGAIVGVQRLSIGRACWNGGLESDKTNTRNDSGGAPDTEKSQRGPASELQIQIGELSK